MKTVEEYGKTVEEAREKALKALGVAPLDEAGVIVEVLDEGSSGSGWGGRKLARVRVTLQRDEAAAPAPIAAPASEAPRAAAAAAGAPKEGPRPDARAARRRPAPRPEPAPSPAPPDEEEEEALDEEEIEEDEFEDEDEDFEESPRDVLEDILELMHLQASVDDEEDETYLNIVGPDLGVLIGKHGQTLEALQYLVNLIVNHHQTERIRVTVDVGGYRQRRERTLQELAQRMARRASDEQSPIALEPMLANERRIIHMALADNPRVETYSQGEEPMRKVIIAPRR